ncbi:hypothetical protein [Azospirillum aestuarii]|uniref:hypothetical protein n=1 Tax=Azospirillum aestuarii TaxID=2802052 RepID=UPI0040551C3B
MGQQPPSADDPRSRLAAELFPREWAAVATRPGASKKRQQLRQRAEAELKLRGLRASGASCATCGSYRTSDPTPGMKEPWCAAESDWKGFVRANPDGLCIHHHAPAPR